MRLHMAVERGFYSEDAFTHTALERLFSCVDPQMSNKVTWLFKSFQTRWALILVAVTDHALGS